MKQFTFNQKFYILKMFLPFHVAQLISGPTIEHIKNNLNLEVEEGKPFIIAHQSASDLTFCSVTSPDGELMKRTGTVGQRMILHDSGVVKTY